MDGRSKIISTLSSSQFVLLLPLLLLRLLQAALFLPLVTAVAHALVAGCPPHAPLPPRRAAAARRFLSWWAAFLLRSGFYVWPVVKGKHNLTGAEEGGAPFIIVFNHVSYLDGLVLAELAAPAALAKASVAAAPCVGPWTRALQCAFVERGGGAGGTVAALAARLARPGWPPLAVAPEGTTKPARCLLRFRTGAFAAAVATGTPVVPVVLDYRGRVNPGWGVMRPAATLVHLLRMHAQLDTRATVTVLPAMAPAPGDGADTFAATVRAAMGEAAGLPLVDAGLEEWAALKKAGVSVDWTGRKLMVGGAETKEE